MTIPILQATNRELRDASEFVRTNKAFFGAIVFFYVVALAAAFKLNRYTRIRSDLEIPRGSHIRIFTSILGRITFCLAGNNWSTSQSYNRNRLSPCVAMANPGFASASAFGQAKNTFYFALDGTICGA